VVSEQLRFAPRAAGGHSRARRQVWYSKVWPEAATSRLPGGPIRRIFFRNCPPEMFFVAVNQHITDIRAFADRPEFQTSRQFRRQIFQTVNSKIRLMLEKRDFQFFGEKSFGQALALLR